MSGRVKVCAADVVKKLSRVPKKFGTEESAGFINGIFLNGARPYEDFKEIIDEELAAKK